MMQENVTTSPGQDMPPSSEGKRTSIKLVMLIVGVISFMVFLIFSITKPPYLVYDDAYEGKWYEVREPIDGRNVFSVFSVKDGQLFRSYGDEYTIQNGKLYKVDGTDGEWVYTAMEPYKGELYKVRGPFQDGRASTYTVVDGELFKIKETDDDELYTVRDGELYKVHDTGSERVFTIQDGEWYEVRVSSDHGELYWYDGKYYEVRTISDDVIAEYRRNDDNAIARAIAKARENGWQDIPQKVYWIIAIMLVISAAFLGVGGGRHRQKTDTLSLCLTISGIIGLFVTLALVVSFLVEIFPGYYPRVLEPPVLYLVLSLFLLFSGGSFWLAHRHNSQIIAFFALIGTYFSISFFGNSRELLFITDETEYVVLLVFLNLFALAFSYSRKWRFLLAFSYILNLAMAGLHAIDDLISGLAHTTAYPFAPYLFLIALTSPLWFLLLPKLMRGELQAQNQRMTEQSKTAESTIGSPEAPPPASPTGNSDKDK
ncbi:MAG: hypothetical protein FWC40_06765 [Proteobacteria bacterium]|nr:hypothetical protein [Pseudomonadota bacterium]